MNIITVAFAEESSLSVKTLPETTSNNSKSGAVNLSGFILLGVSAINHYLNLLTALHQMLKQAGV
jgi:hypothetical protein